jgi:TonB-linked SusC/RagA family outer membrane protein
MDKKSGGALTPAGPLHHADMANLLNLTHLTINHNVKSMKICTLNLSSHILRRPIIKSLMIMKLIMLLMITTCIQVNATVYGQAITLSKSNVRLSAVFKEIEKQGYLFWYEDALLKESKNVSISVKAAPIEKVLAICFADQPLSYAVVDNIIVVKRKNEKMPELMQVEIRGKVTDEKGGPLPGATVRVKGTTVAVITDANGNFRLPNVAPNATLVVSSVGFVNQEIAAGNRSAINILLKEDTQGLNEIVVVGYGVQKKENITGAVDVISNKQIQDRQAPTVSQLLQGQSPALSFSTNNFGFQPGAELNIAVRGTGSLNGGSPYVLIDGIPGDMNRINPQDIESISVLKDAAASAIYGARAPYGVILITTKSGAKNEKVGVNYSGSVTMATPQRLPQMLDSYTHARVQNEAGVAGAGGRVYSDATIDKIIAYQNGNYDYLRGLTVPGATYFETTPMANGTWGINNFGNANYDWFDEYYGSGTNQKHDLSVQGGSKATSYYLSGGFTDQEGVLNYGEDTFSRINLLGKIQTALAPWWDLKYQPRFMKSNRTLPSMDKQGEYDLIFHQVARTLPTNAKYDAFGNYMIQSKIPWIADGGTDDTENTEHWQNIFTEIRPAKNWKINADLAYQNVNRFRSKKEFTVFEVLPDGSSIPSANTVPSNIRQVHFSNTYWTSNIYSSYELKVQDKHTFRFLAGTQFELNKSKGLDVSKTNLLVQGVPSLQTASGEASAVENLEHWSTQGYFGRLNYDFDGRYLFEANVRNDGTSRFREGNQWGTFPSFSAGWNVSNEKFWQPISRAVNVLKFRGSWGTLGNQNVDSYQDLSLIPLRSTPVNWIFGYGQVRDIGFTEAPRLVSPDLTWETATAKNLGVDMAFLNNRLQATVDIFERVTDDMIGPAEAQPGVLGTALPKANNSTFRTRGWEASLRWNHKTSDNFSYFATVNMYDARSFVTKYTNPTGTLAANTWYAGKEQGEIWGYESNGLYQSQEEITAHQANTNTSFIWSGVWRTGDVRYEDINGDGKVNNGSNTLADPGDLRIIGNSNPRYQFGISAGFNYKNFDFSMLWNGTAKRDFSFGNEENIYWGFRVFGQTSIFPNHLDYFRDQVGDKYTGLYEGDANLNTGAFWPRPYASNPENNKNRHPTTRYLQSGAFMRLQNLQIGYRIPQSLSGHLKLQSIRAYVSAENLVTFTKLPKGIDPVATGSAEWGVGKTYGADRMVAFGLSISY